MTAKSLTIPQSRLVMTESPFPAFVAGYASGKSEAVIQRIMRLKFQYPELPCAYYLPTYDLVNTIAYPRIAEFLETFNIPYRINKQEKIVKIKGAGEIICRTMDRPERIIGYETADSVLDEIDTLPTDKARDVWNKVLARNRAKKPDGKPNTIAVATTPEGFKFTYDVWGKDTKPGYELIKASTYSNAHNLPEGYIQSLIDVYPSNLLQAYLEGEFVNLTQGTVYTGFSDLCHCPAEMTENVLHIGMDFNVTNMNAIVAQIIDRKAQCIDELTGLYDTPAMIAAIKSRWPNHKIIVYPDSSGGARKTVNASQSDLSLLRQAGFAVMADRKNPPVKDRIMSVNAALENGTVKINFDKCPLLVESLRKQAYNNRGEPDKQSGYDHITEALGYFINYKFPVVRKTVQTFNLKGL